MKIFILLVSIFASLSAVAGEPRCSSLFERNSADIQAQVKELSEVLTILNLDARLLIEEYNFRPKLKRPTNSRFSSNAQGDIYETLSSKTLNAREAMSRKNKLLKEIPKDNEDFQKLTLMDNKMEFEAQYLGRINALGVLIRSHLGLMPEDIFRSYNMTNDGKYSIVTSPEISAQKIKSNQILKQMLGELNKLASAQLAEEVLLGRAEKSALLSELEANGNALIKRLMFRFRLDPSLIETLLSEWAAVHARQSRNIYAPYIQRLDDYSWWPI